jgi:glycosyltransferase involved in cell wall biosynthesis
MNILYWCPYLSHVATVKAVLNSALSIQQYSKKKLTPQIINSVGEWDDHREYLEKNNIEILNLSNLKSFYLNLPRNSFVKSRISYFLIGIFSIYKLYKFLKKKNEKDIFVIHLISYVPLLLLIIFNFKCKVILRISGYPKLNFVRSLLWRLSNKKLSAIICPTLDTKDYLIKKKIFSKKKCHVLKDPIINLQNLNYLKNDQLEKKLLKKKYILNIGRLVSQKNQSFLINAFKKILEFDNEYILIILGEGELENKLKNLAKKLQIEQKILFLGHVENVFKYLKNAKYFVLTSRWEDPGFVLLESAFARTCIISADCPNGPREILENGKGGFLFKSGNLESFLSVFLEAEHIGENIKNKKKLEVLKKTLDYTKFRHFNNFSRIIDLIRN